MKLVTYMADGKEIVGVLTPAEKIVGLGALNPAWESYDMNAVIAAWDTVDPATWSEQLASAEACPLGEVTLCSPIVRPRHDIICVGENYRDHAAEVAENFGDNLKRTAETIYFGKRASHILGDGDTVSGRFDLDEQLDYEVELAVVIGRRGRGIEAEEARDYIFSYTILNDLSSRALQKAHTQWYLGKSLDDYAAMGPYLATVDELDWPLAVEVSTTVNGELRQRSNTSLLLKDIPALIAEISRGITLEPGDIIATGTPAGVGMGMNPKGFLKRGDLVACAIEGLGVLQNTIA